MKLDQQQTCKLNKINYNIFSRIQHNFIEFGLIFFDDGLLQNI